MLAAGDKDIVKDLHVGRQALDYGLKERYDIRRTRISDDDRMVCMINFACFREEIIARFSKLTILEMKVTSLGKEFI